MKSQGSSDFASGEACHANWVSRDSVLLSTWLSTGHGRHRPPPTRQARHPTRRKGAVPLAPGERSPGDKAGFIIIRPNGKGTTTSQVAAPATGHRAATPAGSGALTFRRPARPARGARSSSTTGSPSASRDSGSATSTGPRRRSRQGDKTFASASGIRTSRSPASARWWRSGARNRPSSHSTGEVFVTSMRQESGKDQALALTGVVEGKDAQGQGRRRRDGSERHALAGRRGRARSRTAPVQGAEAQDRASPSTTPPTSRSCQSRGEDDQSRSRARSSKSSGRTRPRGNFSGSSPNRTPIGKVKLPRLDDLGRRGDLRAAPDGNRFPRRSAAG